MELVSIIVPIYKVEEYLDECVLSLLHQTYEKLEVILVDDGSPDRCPEMCDAWAKKDRRIRVIHKKNGGLSDARNAGLQLATGEYIAFVDSDDWVEATYIEYLLRALQKTASDIAACDLTERSHRAEPNRAEMPEPRVATPEQALNELIHGTGFRAVVWNKLYRAELVKEERFAVGRLHEDEFFTYRILDKARRLVYLDTPLYDYRQREGSIMSSFSVKHLDALDAYLARSALFKEKYPTLYTRDRATFCFACLSYYCGTFTQKYEDVKAVRKKIRDFRATQRFSLTEYLHYNRRQKIYILLTAGRLIDITAYLRVRRHG